MNVPIGEIKTPRETGLYHKQPCFLSPLLLRRKEKETDLQLPSPFFLARRFSSLSTRKIALKSNWGYRSTPSCSSLQRNGDLGMKRMGIFLSVAVLSLSLLLPPLASAGNTADSSTSSHQTTTPKKSKRHAKDTSRKHKSSANSSTTSQEQ